MSPDPGTWTATVRVHAPSEHVAQMLELALRPEADREVPRARGQLSRPHPNEVALAVTARDGGAMRAALNTYLGWVSLSVATLRSATSDRLK
jgi:tRNA threonylcarbamoyladenosine modification (KEOPS) complex  Pcc1 subunit